jgi:hypothetical protein
MPSPCGTPVLAFIPTRNMLVSQHAYLIGFHTPGGPAGHADNLVVLLTMLLPRNAESFRISHQEMIKGVRIGGNGKTLRFFDTLEVPIIENTADEEDLTDGMAQVRAKLTSWPTPSFP